MFVEDKEGIFAKAVRALRGEQEDEYGVCAVATARATMTSTPSTLHARYAHMSPRITSTSRSSAPALPPCIPGPGSGHRCRPQGMPWAFSVFILEGSPDQLGVASDGA